MKYYSLLIISLAVLLSCTKDDISQLPSYKQLDLVTNNGDTIYYIEYDDMKRPILIRERFTESVFDYGLNGVSKILVKQVFDKELFDSLEYLYHYHPFHRLDSIQTIERINDQRDYIYTWRFHYKNSQVSEIFYDRHRTDVNRHRTSNTTFEYADGNIITTRRNLIEPDDGNEKISYEFDDKINPFKPLDGILTRLRTSLLANPLNTNNIISSVHERSWSATKTSEISEYKYDEDDYPIERKTITFNGETSTGSVWRFYYKED